MCVCDLTRACLFLNTISPNPESLANNISFDLTKCFLSRFERAFCYDAFPVHRTMFFKQASDSIGRPRPFAARVSFSQNFQADLQAADGTHARTHAHLHKLLNTRHCSTACDSRYVTCYKEQRRSNNVIIVSLCIQESGEKHTQESRIRRGCLYLFCTIQCARGCKGATEIYPHRTFVLPFLSFFFFFLLDRHSTCAPVISRLPSTGHRTPRKHRLETASLFPFYSKEIPMAHDDTRTYTHKVRRNYQTLLVNLFSRLRHCRACQSNVRYPFCQQRSSISPYLYDFQKQSR